MKSVLKCVYTILFLILIASSSALFILVASESMQNLNTVSQIIQEENNFAKISVHEKLVKSESVSCDNDESESKNCISIDTQDNLVTSNTHVKKIEEGFKIETDENLDPSEISNKAKLEKEKKVIEPYLVSDNITNTQFEIYTESNPSKNSDINQLDDIKINTFTNVDEAQKDPPITRDIPPDKTEQRILDSGGSIIITSILNESEELLSKESKFVSESDNVKSIEKNSEPNITEEKPIPVFSEWAQKQMEEAEKKLEKDVENVSSMKKNYTNGNKATPNLLKLRVKNYASLDCGAKIITSNSEAQNTGALLTSSKDEYMLSPCTSRIWFVVELCEAIQAKHIDFANFELFSSSPKNFTVAVSNRFPTRDWLNVGRFIADDTRNIQSFDLFPHLFGKYVRVDVHSHYNSEHFCPISLLRVYGTSEFEAFDSENRNPYEEMEDVEDEIVQIDPVKKEDNNLFKSASDAVMSIVKKAAQVLSKEKPNRTDLNENENILCFTPAFKNFVCQNCSQITIQNINFLLSCKYKELIQLLSIKEIFSHLMRSQFCFQRFNIDISSIKKKIIGSQEISSTLTSNKTLLKCNHSKNFKYNCNLCENDFFIEEKQSYYLSSININYLGAMCHILTDQNVLDAKLEEKSFRICNDNSSLNLTIEKSIKKKDPLMIDKSKDNLKIDYTIDEKLNKNTPTILVEGPITENSKKLLSDDINVSTDTNKEIVTEDELKNIDAYPSKENLGSIESVNIFNIIRENTSVEDDSERFSEEVINKGTISNESKLNNKLEESFESSSTSVLPTISNRAKEEDSQWENDEKLFNEHISDDISLIKDQVTLNVNGNNVNQHKSGQHSESVFTRLSNRIKALERNMSLSGQYLEELSRRYKKQVEELQNSFSKSLIAIEDQNRRFGELEFMLKKQNTLIQSDLEELKVKLHFWMFVLIIVTTIGLVYILTSFYSVTIIGRRQKTLLKQFEETAKQHKNKEKLKRRISSDGVTRKTNKKTRRPSEEAMKINGSYKDLMIEDDTNSCYGDSIENLNSSEQYINNQCGENSDCNNKSNIRNRKISVCYSKENQPILKKRSITQKYNKNEQNVKDNNKGTKNYMITVDNSDKDHDDFNEQENEIISEEIIIVDDESDQFMSGCDSTYEYVASKIKNENLRSSDKQNKFNNKFLKPKKTEASVKIRRLSSPSFLKSPFNKRTTPTESTGWEWIRNASNKNGKKKKNPSIENRNNSEFFKYVISNSLDGDRNIFTEKNPSPNSTVSEQINFHNNLNNGENDSLRTTNSDTSSLQASNEGPSLSGIQESDIFIAPNESLNINNNRENNGLINGNKTKTKKQRSFKKIFKKVF